MKGFSQILVTSKKCKPIQWTPVSWEIVTFHTHKEFDFRMKSEGTAQERWWGHFRKIYSRLSGNDARSPYASRDGIPGFFCSVDDPGMRFAIFS